MRPTVEPVESSPRRQPVVPTKGSTALSAALLPIGVIILFSFGGQVVFAPFALAIEWVLARVAKTPVRIAWSLLAGVLAGEFVYLLIDLRSERFDGLAAVVAGLAVAVVVALGFVLTTGTLPRPRRNPADRLDE